MSDKNSAYIYDIGGDVKGILGDVKGGVVNQYIIAQKSQAEIRSQRLIKGSPYLGLNKFESEDKDKFFGREQWITKLSKDLEKNNLLLLLGASGSGKSSLVQAGIIPYLSDEWGAAKLVKLIFVPYKDPFKSLYHSLPNKYKNTATEIINQKNNDSLVKLIDELKEGSEQWIVFIDQLEEIFTITPKLKRDQFIADLVSLMKQQDSSVKLIMAMRSDFLDNLREYGDFTNEVESRIRLVRDMSESELRLVIAEPAARNGVTFEKGLVAQIISDFKQQAGSLPLLQYTLDLLWEKDGIAAENRVLNIKTYDDLGGVSGALQQQANYIYNKKLNDEEKKAAEKIFLELIDLAVKEPVSRRVEQSQFRDTNVRQSALNKLIESRLLVSGRDKSTTVEVAHEELLRSWEFIQNLIQQKEEIIILRSRLVADASQWNELQKEDKEKAKDELWSGSKLERVLELVQEKAFGNLDETSEQFIQESVGKRDREAQEKEAQRRREIRILQEKLKAEKIAKIAEESAKKVFQEKLKAEEIAKRKLKQRAIIAISTAILTFIAFIVAILQWRNAHIQAKTTRSIQLANASSTSINVDSTRALLLAIQSLIYHDTPQARLALWEAFQNNHERTILYGHDGEVGHAKFHPTDSGQIITVSDDKSARIWNLDTLNEPVVLQGHKATVSSGSFDPHNNNRVLTTSYDGRVLIWDLRQPKKPLLLGRHQSLVNSANFDIKNQNRVITASSDGKAIVWDVNSPQVPVATLEHKVDVWHARFVPYNPSQVLTVSQDGVIRIWKLTEPDAPVAQLRGNKGEVLHVSFNPNNPHLLIASGTDKMTRVWNFKTSIEPEPLVLKGHDGFVNDADFDPTDANRIMTVSSDGTAKVWDLNLKNNQGNVSPLVTLRGHRGEVTQGIFNPQIPNIVLTVSDDGTAKVWNIGKRNNPLLKTLYGHKDKITSGEFDAENPHRILTASSDGTARVWDIRSQSYALLSDNVSSVETNAIAAAFNINSPDSIIALSKEGIIKQWNLDEPNKPEILTKLKLNSSIKRGVFAVNNPNVLATVNSDGRVYLWNLDENESELPQVLAATRDDYRAVNFDPANSGRLVAIAGNTATVWDVQSGDIINLSASPSVISHTAFAPKNSKRVVTANAEGKVYVWNLNQPEKPEIELNASSEAIWFVGFHPHKSNLLLTAGTDRVVRIWDLNTQRLVDGGELSGHENTVVHASFSNQDPQRLLTVSYDKTARIWNTSSSDNYSLILRGQGDEVVYGSFNPKNENQVLTITIGGELLVYAVGGEELLKSAISSVSRCLSLQEEFKYNVDRFELLKSFRKYFDDSEQVMSKFKYLKNCKTALSK